MAKISYKRENRPFFR